MYKNNGYTLTAFMVVRIQGNNEILAEWDDGEKKELLCYHDISDGTVIMPLSAVTPREFPTFPVELIDNIVYNNDQSFLTSPN